MQSQRPEPEDKPKKKSTRDILAELLHYIADSPHPVCTDEVCYAAPQNTYHTFAGQDMMIPRDLRNQLTDTIKNGFALSAICTLTDDLVREELRDHEIDERYAPHISYACRMVLLIGLGSSPFKTLCSSVGMYLLNRLGFSPNKAAAITGSAMIAHELWTHPEGVGTAGLNISAGLFGSILGVLTGRLSKNPFLELIERRLEHRIRPTL